MACNSQTASTVPLRGDIDGDINDKLIETGLIHATTDLLFLPDKESTSVKDEIHELYENVLEWTKCEKLRNVWFSPMSAERPENPDSTVTPVTSFGPLFSSSSPEDSEEKSDVGSLYYKSVSCLTSVDIQVCSELKWLFYKTYDLCEDTVFCYGRIVGCLQLTLDNLTNVYDFFKHGRGTEAMMLLESSEAIQISLCNCIEFGGTLHNIQNMSDTMEKFITETLVMKGCKSNDIHHANGSVKIIQCAVHHLKITLQEVVSDIKYFAERHCSKIRSTIRCSTNKEANKKSWNSRSTRKMFTKYLSCCIALSLVCYDFIIILKDVKDNLRSTMHKFHTCELTTTI